MKAHVVTPRIRFSIQKEDDIMVKVREDFTGRRFGRLVVIKQAEDYISQKGCRVAQWLCRCDCDGKDVIIRGSDLKSEKVKSCGCLHIENTIKRNKAGHKTNIWEDDIFEDEYGKYKIGYCYTTGNKFYVDFDDYELVKDHCWSEIVHTGSNYSSLRAKINNKSVKMTKLLGLEYYDHIDRNTLNNRRCNLRPATAMDNARNKSTQHNNKSGVSGVFLPKDSKKWIAYITINKKRKHLGSFADKNDAIKARLEAELKYFGDFAPQQNLFEQYGIVNKP